MYESFLIQNPQKFILAISEKNFIIDESKFLKIDILVIFLENPLKCRFRLKSRKIFEFHKI